jgi:hypothetical protein
MALADLHLLTLLVRICSLGVSVLGLVLVIGQLKKLSQSIQGNAFSSSFSELREIHKVFIDYPSLRPYFFENKVPDRGSDEYQQARSIAEMYLDAFVHMYLLRSRFPEGLHRHIDLLIEDMVSRSTFLVSYLKENYKFLPDPLRLFVSSSVETRQL